MHQPISEMSNREPGNICVPIRLNRVREKANIPCWVRSLALAHVNLVSDIGVRIEAVVLSFYTSPRSAPRDKIQD